MSAALQSGAGPSIATLGIAWLSIRWSLRIKLASFTMTSAHRRTDHANDITTSRNVSSSVCRIWPTRATSTLDSALPTGNVLCTPHKLARKAFGQPRSSACETLGVAPFSRPEDPVKQLTSDLASTVGLPFSIQHYVSANGDPADVDAGFGSWAPSARSTQA